MKLGDNSKGCRKSSDGRCKHIFTRGVILPKLAPGGIQLNVPLNKALNKWRAGCLRFDSHSAQTSRGFNDCFLDQMVPITQF